MGIPSAILARMYCGKAKDASLDGLEKIGDVFLFI